MSTQDREDNTTYKVVVNHEDHYSIWHADRENPDGATPPSRDRHRNASTTSRACGPTCGR